MSDDALNWCRQRLLVPGNPLTVSLAFAPPDLRDAILALRAVQTEIAAIPGSVSDPGVARRKLAWWQAALADDPPPAHPALQALQRAGVSRRLAAQDWRPLIDGIATSIVRPRFERFEALWVHCRDIGGAAFALEARLGASDDALEPFIELGAAGYLDRVTRDLRLDADQDRWLPSLDLQARFQIERKQVAEGRDSPAWQGLVLELVSRSYRAREAALARLTPAQTWRHRHLIISAALDARLGRTLARRPARILRQRVLPARLGNVLTAWRTARRLAYAANTAGVARSEQASHRKR